MSTYSKNRNNTLTHNKIVNKSSNKRIDKPVFYKRKINNTININKNIQEFIDKEKNIELFKKAGWHFNNIMTPEEISLKLKTFAHSEFSDKKYSSTEVIKKKINQREDLFKRGHKYEVVKLDYNFPKYILDNLKKFNEIIY